MRINTLYILIIFFELILCGIVTSQIYLKLIPMSSGMILLSLILLTIILIIYLSRRGKRNEVIKPLDQKKYDYEQRKNNLFKNTTQSPE
ncbi:MAG: hypothetical protein K0R24_2369 [Gammaproteobacteria bacterium]|jgi:Ni,Fe-hydrogenase I cytochrome b subunit|nr:hypothetical protein [Gammaproteobacteria bacterium]